MNNIMQIDTLETHDRFLEFQKQAQIVSQGVQDCINGLPDTITEPFYVFGHPRSLGMDEKFDIMMRTGTLDPKQIPSTRMVWIPMPRKPKAVLNSYLFRARKGTDIIRIIWILPPREIWSNFEPGKMTQNENVYISINNYKHARSMLEAPEPDDLTEAQVDEFREKIKQAAIDKRRSKIVNIEDYRKI